MKVLEDDKDVMPVKLPRKPPQRKEIDEALSKKTKNKSMDVQSYDMCGDTITRGVVNPRNQCRGVDGECWCQRWHVRGYNRKTYKGHYRYPSIEVMMPKTLMPIDVGDKCKA